MGLRRHFRFVGASMQHEPQLIGEVYYCQYGRGLLGDVGDGAVQIERVFPERRPRRVLRAERKRKAKVRR